MSLISLCLMEGNPPFGQDRTCSMHGEVVTTGTSRGSMKRQPTRLECKNINGPFVQGETELADWKGGKLTGCVFLLGKCHSPLKEW